MFFLVLPTSKNIAKIDCRINQLHDISWIICWDILQDSEAINHEALSYVFTLVRWCNSSWVSIRELALI